MTRWTIVLVATLSLATIGCKKKGGGGEVLEKMEGFSKSMCDCKDKACADKVNEEMTKWGTEMAKTADKDAKPDPEMAKKSADVMTKYTECMTKLMMAGADKKPDPPKPETPPAPTEILGDKIALEFVKEANGDAVFKVTNNTTSCTVTELGYSGYAYDKAGTKLGGAGGGKTLEPLAPGKSVEAKFSASSKYTKDAVAEVVITSVTCQDGTKWDDSGRAKPDRKMGSKP
jgi:hypothetical protein